MRLTVFFTPARTGGAALSALATLALVACGGTTPTRTEPAAPAASTTPTLNGAPVRIGVALGGGAAKGFAHIGVIKMLEANGLRPPWCRAPAQAAWWARCMPAA